MKLHTNGNRTFLGLAGTFTLMLPLMASATDNPGGFIEPITDQSTRPTLSQSQINEFLPDRGEFTFPSPYNTRGIRLTTDSDCGGQDCVAYAGYSYWRNINNHTGQDTLLAFVGLNRNQGGQGPTLFEYHKTDGTLQSLGPIFDDDDSLSWYTGEGWYFSATRPDTLYVNDRNRIIRLNVRTGAKETVMDIGDTAGSGYRITQVHSSDDDNVHSATVQDASNWSTLGCMVYTEDMDRYQFFARKGPFDECQVDRSGHWLVIKENVDGQDGEDNRIIHIDSGHERVLLDRDGAAGHSDLGYGTMIAADNWANEANTWKLWDFEDENLTGSVMYHNNDWGAFAPSHISHSNSRADVPVEQQYACGGSVNRTNSPHANEVICFGMDGSKDTLVVAPVMTDLDASGGPHDYGKRPKGNLDVTGRYFFWTSNAGGDRLDAFIVRVPSIFADNIPQSAPSDEPVTETEPVEDTTTEPDDGDSTEQPAEETVDPAPSGDSTFWPNPINATVTNDVLTKTGGCHQCSDAGAVSGNQLLEGDGQFSFTATDDSRLLMAGLSQGSDTSLPGSIDFAIRLQAGFAEVRERGVYRTDTAFNAGDSFSIRVENGTVHYLRNGNAFHTSAVAPAYPMQAEAVLYDVDSAISHAGLEGTLSGSEPATDETVDPVSPEDPTSPEGSTLWPNPINATVTDDVLTKTDGCHQCSDAGAVSGNQLLEGDGQFSFTATDDSRLLMAGLSQGSDTSLPGSIDFAIRLQAGFAEVRERGVYRTDTAFNAGDSFSIRVENGTVHYLRNGNAFHTSAVAPAYPMQAEAVLYDAGSAIADTRLDGSLGASTPDPESTEKAENVSLDAVVTGEVAANSVLWTDTSQVSVSVNRLTKQGGCDGCSDASALSLQQLLEGNGKLTFTATDTEKLLVIGLSDAQAAGSVRDINAGLRLQAGNAEVRVNGRYRAGTPFQKGDKFAIKLTDGTVEYAKNGVTFHSHRQASMKYPLQVSTVLYSQDSSVEGVTLSSDQAPRISDIQATATGDTSARVDWNTDSPSESLVQFGSTIEYSADTEHRTALSTKHSATLSGLTPGQTYHFRVFNRDASGHIVSSEDHRLTMPVH